MLYISSCGVQMSNLTEKLTVRCDNDCKMQGCPTHEFELQYQSVSDHFTVVKDGEIEWEADLNEMHALIVTLERMAKYRVEVAGVLS